MVQKPAGSATAECRLLDATKFGARVPVSANKERQKTHLFPVDSCACCGNIRRSNAVTCVLELFVGQRLDRHGERLHYGGTRARRRARVVVGFGYFYSLRSHANTRNTDTDETVNTARTDDNTLTGPLFPPGRRVTTTRATMDGQPRRSYPAQCPTRQKTAGMRALDAG